MARSVNERDGVPILVHLVRTNVLGDASGFTGDDICRTDLVEQRSFAMVNVSHDGDNGWTRLLSCFVFIIAVVEQRLQFHFFLLTWIDKKNVGANFKCEQFHLLVTECHGGRHHFAVLKQEAHDIGCSAIQLRSKLLG